MPAKTPNPQEIHTTTHSYTRKLPLARVAHQRLTRGVVSERVAAASDRQGNGDD